MWSKIPIKIYLIIQVYNFKFLLLRMAKILFSFKLPITLSTLSLIIQNSLEILEEKLSQSNNHHQLSKKLKCCITFI